MIVAARSIEGDCSTFQCFVVDTSLLQSNRGDGQEKSISFPFPVMFAALSNGR